VAANGDLRLVPSPGQWSPIPKGGARNSDRGIKAGEVEEIHGELLSGPLASGKTLVIASEYDLQRIVITSHRRKAFSCFSYCQ